MEIPSIAWAYNSFMGYVAHECVRWVQVKTHQGRGHASGVDIADQNRSCYTPLTRSLRSWFPVFIWALETAIINSQVVWSALFGKNSLPHYDFRVALVQSLLQLGETLNAGGRLRAAVMHEYTAPGKKIIRQLGWCARPATRKLPGVHMCEKIVRGSTTVKAMSRPKCERCRFETQMRINEMDDTYKAAFARHKTMVQVLKQQGVPVVVARPGEVVPVVAAGTQVLTLPQPLDRKVRSHAWNTCNRTQYRCRVCKAPLCPECEYLWHHGYDDVKTVKFT